MKRISADHPRFLVEPPQPCQTPHHPVKLAWHLVSHAAHIELTVDAQRYSGVVDGMTPDLQVMWLQLDKGRGRKMFHASEVTLIRPLAN